MSSFDLQRKSRPIVIVPHRESWTDEFDALKRQISALASGFFLRIDHIGSTAVPGLGAKDVIDIQITVAALERSDTLVRQLGAGGFRLKPAIQSDVFYGMAEGDSGLAKLYLREPEGARRTHVHVRETGRFNQRYALLFRDYLRASKEARTAYEVLKQRLATVFPSSIDGYLFIKEPAMHLLYEAASRWAEQVKWEPEPV